MNRSIAAMALMLAGCASGPLPWARAPQSSEPACTASCDAHFDQCPRIFVNFPERAAVECPAEHDICLKSCASRREAGATAPAGAPPPASAAVAPGPAAKVPADSAVPSKEARLRELKHLYDEGLVSDDVYRERQRAILSEPDR